MAGKENARMMKKLLLLLLFLLLLLPMTAGADTEFQMTDKLSSRWVMMGGEHFWYLPKVEEGEQVPLILFLHGGDHTPTLDFFPHEIRFEHKEYPFAVLAPKNDNGTWLTIIEETICTLEYVLQNYPIDRSRVYILGPSAGGIGAYAIAAAYPDYFAAICPIAGRGSTSLAPNLVNVPVWAFHGTADERVSYYDDENLINAIKALGGDAKLRTFKGGDHFRPCTYAEYYIDQLIDWMMQYSKDPVTHVLTKTPNE